MVADDIANGTVPADVDSFGELHDHVDANDYVAQAREDLGLAELCDWDDEADVTRDNNAMTLVAQWLRAGRPAA